MSSELPTYTIPADYSHFEFPAPVADQSASRELPVTYIANSGTQEYYQRFPNTIRVAQPPNSRAGSYQQRMVEPPVSGDWGNTPTLITAPGTAYSRGGVSMTPASMGASRIYRGYTPTPTMLTSTSQTNGYPNNTGESTHQSNIFVWHQYINADYYSLYDYTYLIYYYRIIIYIIIEFLNLIIIL